MDKSTSTAQNVLLINGEQKQLSLLFQSLLHVQRQPGTKVTLWQFCVLVKETPLLKMGGCYSKNV